MIKIIIFSLLFLSSCGVQVDYYYTDCYLRKIDDKTVLVCEVKE